jgi:hypothetical protein
MTLRNRPACGFPRLSLCLRILDANELWDALVSCHLGFTGFEIGSRETPEGLAMLVS